MADDQEKTEEPSSKKIEDARKDGNVPKSQDTSAFITLLVALVAFLALLSFIQSRIVYLYYYYQSLIGTEITKEVTLQVSMISFREIIFMVIPLSLAVAIAGILAKKKFIPESPGTLRTDSYTFGAMTLAVIIIVTALSYLPALALGPIAEYFSLY